MSREPTQERLAELFWDAGGDLKRKLAISQHASGVSAGFLHKKLNRHVVKVDGRGHLRSRLIWILANGSIPEGFEVDHVDRDTTNDRISNLRLATRQQNMMNRSVAVNNKSGVPGVYWNKTRNKWIADIKLNGKHRYLGSFANFDDACNARWAAEKKHFGEFRPQT